MILDKIFKFFSGQRSRTLSGELPDFQKSPGRFSHGGKNQNELLLYPPLDNIYHSTNRGCILESHSSEFHHDHMEHTLLNNYFFQAG